MEEKLSEGLKMWRAERPDEWIMDRFIKGAEGLEQENAKLKEGLKRVEAICDEWFIDPMIRNYEWPTGPYYECMFCGTVRDKEGGTNHSYADCPHMKYLEYKGEI